MKILERKRNKWDSNEIKRRTNKKTEVLGGNQLSTSESWQFGLKIVMWCLVANRCILLGHSSKKCFKWISSQKPYFNWSFPIKKNHLCIRLIIVMCDLVRSVSYTSSQYLILTYLWYKTWRVKVMHLQAWKSTCYNSKWTEEVH